MFAGYFLLISSSLNNNIIVFVIFCQYLVVTGTKISATAVDGTFFNCKSSHLVNFTTQTNHNLINNAESHVNRVPCLFITADWINISQSVPDSR